MQRKYLPTVCLITLFALISTNVFAANLILQSSDHTKHSIDMQIITTLSSYLTKPFGIQIGEQSDLEADVHIILADLDDQELKFIVTCIDIAYDILQNGFHSKEQMYQKIQKLLERMSAEKHKTIIQKVLTMLEGVQTQHFGKVLLSKQTIMMSMHKTVAEQSNIKSKLTWMSGVAQLIALGVELFPHIHVKRIIGDDHDWKYGHDEVVHVAWNECYMMQMPTIFIITATLFIIFLFFLIIDCCMARRIRKIKHVEKFLLRVDE